MLKARAHGRLAKYETWRLGKRSLKAEEPARLQRVGYFALELGTEVVHLHGLHVYHTWRGATATCMRCMGATCIRLRYTPRSHLHSIAASPACVAVHSTCVTWMTLRTTSINLRYAPRVLRGRLREPPVRRPVEPAVSSIKLRHKKEKGRWSPPQAGGCLRPPALICGKKGRWRLQH